MKRLRFLFHKTLQEKDYTVNCQATSFHIINCSRLGRRRLHIRHNSTRRRTYGAERKSRAQKGYDFLRLVSTFTFYLEVGAWR